MKRWQVVLFSIICFTIATAISYCCREVVKPRAVAPIPTAARYTYFLPMLSAAYSHQVGLWGSRPDLFGVDMYMDAGARWDLAAQDSRYIPSIRVLSDQLPWCPDRLRFLSEPEFDWDGATGDDFPISPIAAAQRAREIRAQCPSTTLIIGNNCQAICVDPTIRWCARRDAVSNWLYGYVEAGGVLDGKTIIGIHCYADFDHEEGTDTCVDFLSRFKAELWQYFTLKRIAVTEWGIASYQRPIPQARVDEFLRLLDWIEWNSELSAAFIDYCADAPGCLAWRMMDDGLNEVGAALRDHLASRR